MKRAQNEILRDLWNTGTWMQDVWRAYADSEKLDRYKALYAQSAIELFSHPPAFAEDASPMAKLDTLLMAPQILFAQRAEVTRGMQEDLRRLLCAGKLVALGFEPPRKEASMPLLIPANYWPLRDTPGLSQWSKNTLKYASLIFVDVRIVSKQKLEAALPTSTPQPAQMGRPSVNREIKLACLELIDAGRIETALSMKAHYPIIRDHLAQGGLDLPVPPSKINDETIRLVLSPLFKALKEAKKQ